MRISDDGQGKVWDLGVSLGLGLGVDNFFTAEFWELGAEGR